MDKNLSLPFLKKYTFTVILILWFWVGPRNIWRFLLSSPPFGSENCKKPCCGKPILLYISCFLVNTEQLYSLQSPLLYPENPGRDFFVSETPVFQSVLLVFRVQTSCTWCLFTILYFFHILCWSPFSYPILNIFVVSLFLSLFLSPSLSLFRSSGSG